MKMKSLVAILACVALSGCAQRVLLGPIGVVKGYRYDPENNNNVPIGKALDNRQICSDVAWRVGKTDTGKEIVTYICRLGNFEGQLGNGRIPELLEQRIAFNIHGKTAAPVYCDFSYKFPGEQEKSVRNEACFKMAYDAEYNSNWNGLWQYIAYN